MDTIRLSETELSLAKVLNVSDRGDGRHKILQVDHDGALLAIKCYGLKRSRLRTIIRNFGSLHIVGKSSIKSEGRFKTENETLALWKEKGFEVPSVFGLDNPDLQPCIALEWISGPTLSSIFQSVKTPLEDKIGLVEKFAVIAASRHELSIKMNETRLTYEHPTFNHLILSGDRMVHFDFEIVFTWKNDLERLIRREISGFLRSLVNRLQAEEIGPIMRAFVNTYPDRNRLNRILLEIEKYGAIPVLKLPALLRKSLPFGKQKSDRVAAALMVALR